MLRNLRPVRQFGLHRAHEAFPLTLGSGDYLVDRYSERKERAKKLSKRVNQRSI
jgi:hypothetical protein